MLKKATVLAASAGLILTACGGGGSGGSVTAGEPLTITMTEYAFNPADVTIPAGEEVTLEFVNDGTLPHEFMAGRTVSEDDGTPHGFEGEMDAHGFMVLAQPGETVTITFTLPADRVGEWTMGCFEQNGSHWTQGMQGTITVTE